MIKWRKRSENKGSPPRVASILSLAFVPRRTGSSCRGEASHPRLSSWIGAKMAATQRAIRVFAYAPTLTEDDGRPEAVVHGIESALPGIHLTWTVSEDRQMISLEQRDAWLSKTVSEGGFSF